MHLRLRRWVKIALLLLIFLAGILLYSRYIETKLFKIKEYNIINKKIPNNFNGFKILHISDIHYKITTNKNDLEKIIKKINLTKPDIVVFTGDLFDKNYKYTKKDLKELKTLLKNINYNIEKFAIEGENDNEENFNNVFENSDFRILNNEYELIYYKGNDPILIYNITDKNKNVINDIQEDYKYSILLIHKPDLIQKLNLNNTDLVLAGHSLNGQIVIPYVGGLIKRKGANKYFGEYYKIDKTDMYISSGIGTNNYKFRLFNMPSINLYRLKAS